MIELLSILQDPFEIVTFWGGLPQHCREKLPFSSVPRLIAYITIVIISLWGFDYSIIVYLAIPGTSQISVKLSPGFSWFLTCEAPIVRYKVEWRDNVKTLK